MGPPDAKIDEGVLIMIHQYLTKRDNIHFIDNMSKAVYPRCDTNRRNIVFLATWYLNKIQQQGDLIASSFHILDWITTVF